MYTHKVRLLSYDKRRDNVGNIIEEPIEVIRLCKVSSISQSEFYRAATSDLKPDIKVVLHKFEYDGQKVLIIDNIKYRVIKSYEVENRLESRYDRYQFLKFDEIELTCERVIGS